MKIAIHAVDLSVHSYICSASKTTDVATRRIILFNYLHKKSLGARDCLDILAFIFVFA